MSRFDNLDVSPNFKRIQAAFISQVRQAMQSYLDESGEESDNFITGQDVTFAQATELFNDLLLTMNDGQDLGQNKVLDPTNKEGEG